MNPYIEILGHYTPGQTEFEVRPDGSHGHHVAIVAVFDHDWEQHLLVKQCSTGPAARLLGLDEWQYALYYASGGEIIHLRTFFDVPKGRPPLLEAAVMVATWLEAGHYGGETNSVESDSFD